MSRVDVIFYSDEKGCPVLDWLDELPKRIREKGEIRIERLAELGYELKRPEADYLRDGIYELRWRFQSVNYRILYFFYGRQSVVLVHALKKEDVIAFKDIDLAIKRKQLFEANPEARKLKEE